MDIENLIHPNEKPLYLICLTISVICYLSMIITMFGIPFLILGIAFSFLFSTIIIGSIKGNGVLLSEQQFPEVYKVAQKLSQQLGLTSVPDIYIMQSGGILNAFAMKFLDRNFVVIYSEVFELAYENGEEALAFVLCHELAHIQCAHLINRWLLIPSHIVPFLSQAYSRACEYTCDKIAAYVCPEGALSGILILAAGKKLYNRVNIEQYVNQSETRDFSIWFAEVTSSHPILSRRLMVIKNFLSSSTPAQTEGTQATSVNV